MTGLELLSNSSFEKANMPPGKSFLHRKDNCDEVNLVGPEKAEAVARR